LFPQLVEQKKLN